MTDEPISFFNAQLERCNEPGRLCWIFELPGPLPSANKILRIHWGARRDYCQQMQKLVQVVGNQLSIPKAEKKRELFIIQYKHRLFDKDNLYGSVKILVDAIKKEGHLVDDSEKWVYLKVVQLQVKADQEEKVQVILVEIPDASSSG